MTGTTFDLIASITNVGEYTYDNYIELYMYERIPDTDKGTPFKSISKLATITSGETKDVEFKVDGLNLDREYYYYMYYTSAGSYAKLVLPTAGWLFSTDVKIMVDYIMGKNPPGFVFGNADKNNDGKVDAVDLVKRIKVLPK